MTLYTRRLDNSALLDSANFVEKTLHRHEATVADALQDLMGRRQAPPGFGIFLFERGKVFLGDKADGFTPSVKFNDPETVIGLSHNLTFGTSRYKTRFRFPHSI